VLVDSAALGDVRLVFWALRGGAWMLDFSVVLGGRLSMPERLVLLLVVSFALGVPCGCVGVMEEEISLRGGAVDAEFVLLSLRGAAEARDSGVS
jgi:hypothetical protein